MNFAGAGFILFSADLTRVLLVHDTRSGKWGFTKGHREDYDENDLSTAIRECYEETGLTTDYYKIHGESFKINKGGQSYLFYYASLKNDCYMSKMRAGPAHEISGMDWIPLAKLFEAKCILDGNKYLRTWVEDIKNNTSKKSVHLFHSLIQNLTSLLPTQETMCSSNIITCV
jgi:8-oxo-dGTP pyrophosphatase MutT (NUDIX family)